ncbi:hypothetical protein EMPS_03087 [Entomortierella parvispora]|uniref:C2H2-type domain-containing protein n=1 Tax=Entomortierella parvispora TaxID=205924 RepID=A0A9P3H652_9FUNG|nr:hypothetical protein EMPS_03087 [Entomortierella parvispora]
MPSAIGSISEERTMDSLPAMHSGDQDPSLPLVHAANHAYEQDLCQIGHQKGSDHLRQAPDWRPDRDEPRPHGEAAYSRANNPFHNRGPSHSQQLQQVPQIQELCQEPSYASSTKDQWPRLSPTMARANHPHQRQSKEDHFISHTGARPPLQVPPSGYERSRLRSQSPTQTHAMAWAPPAASTAGQPSRYHPYHYPATQLEHRQSDEAYPQRTPPWPAPHRQLQQHPQKQQYQSSGEAEQTRIQGQQTQHQYLHEQRQKQQQQQHQPLHPLDTYSHPQREHRHLVPYNQQYELELGRQQEDMGVHHRHTRTPSAQLIAAGSTQRPIVEHDPANRYTLGPYRRPSAPQPISSREDMEGILAAQSLMSSMHMNRSQPVSPSTSFQTASRQSSANVSQSRATSVTATVAPNNTLADSGGWHLPPSPSRSIPRSATVDPTRTRVPLLEDNPRSNEGLRGRIFGQGTRSLPPLMGRDELLPLEPSPGAVADRRRVSSDRPLASMFDTQSPLSDSLPLPRTQRTGMPVWNRGLEMRAWDIERGSQSNPWTHLGPFTKRYSDGSIHEPRSTLQDVTSTGTSSAHDSRDRPFQNLGYSPRSDLSTPPRQRPVRIGEEGYYGAKELEVLYRLWHPTTKHHQDDRFSNQDGQSFSYQTQERASSEGDLDYKGKGPMSNAWQDERRNHEFRQYTPSREDTRGYNRGFNSCDNGAANDDNFNSDGRHGDESSLMDVDDKDLDREDEDEDEDGDGGQDGEVDHNGAPLGRTQSRESGDGSERSTDGQTDTTDAGTSTGGPVDHANVIPRTTEGGSSSTRASRRVRVQEAKNHQCEECGKKFSRPSQLQTHSFTHNGLKPHQCKTCKKFFNVASNLKRHIRTHATTKRKSSRTGSTVFRSFAHSLPVSSDVGTSTGGKSKQQADRQTKGQSTSSSSASVDKAALAPTQSSLLTPNEPLQVVFEPLETLRWMDTETPLTGSLMGTANQSKTQRSSRRMPSAAVDRGRSRRGSDGGAIGRGRSFSSNSSNTSVAMTPLSGSTDSASTAASTSSGSSTAVSSSSGSSTAASNKSSSEPSNSPVSRHPAQYIPSTLSGPNVVASERNESKAARRTDGEEKDQHPATTTQHPPNIQ